MERPILKFCASYLPPAAELAQLLAAAGQERVAEDAAELIIINNAAELPRPYPIVLVADPAEFTASLRERSQAALALAIVEEECCILAADEIAFTVGELLAGHLALRPVRIDLADQERFVAAVAGYQQAKAQLQDSLNMIGQLSRKANSNQL